MLQQVHLGIYATATELCQLGLLLATGGSTETNSHSNLLSVIAGVVVSPPAATPL